MVYGWIYLITNLVNGKIYVGQTCNPNLLKYFKHKICTSRSARARTPILDAFRKYGPENFALQVLVKDVTGDREHLDRLERFFIRVLDARSKGVGYNLTEGGGGVRKPCSEDTKKKLSAIHKGRTVSPETRAKISAYQLGRKRGPMPQDRKDRISRSKLGKPGHACPLEHRLRLSRARKFWFTKEQLTEIENRHSAGETKTAIGKCFGVSIQTIDRLLKKQHFCQDTLPV